MAYVIRWVAADGARVVPAMRFSVKGEAMDWACAALGERPRDLWIEDERGVHVADMLAVIIHCRRLGFRPVGVERARWLQRLKDQRKQEIAGRRRA